MKQIFLLLIFSFVLSSSAVTAKTLNKVVAVVNDEMISSFELEQSVVAALKKTPDQNQLTSEEFDQIERDVLQKLINDKLLGQRINELGLKVPDAELNNAIEDVRTKNGLTPESLKQALAAQGLTMAQYRSQIRKEILRYKLLSREVNYKVLVTQSEVQRYFNDHIEEYINEPEVRVNRISFDLPVGDDEQVAELHKRAETSRDKLLNGEDFNQVLEELEGFATGGDMGKFVESDLAKPLQLALEGLEEGDVSQPLELNGQLHVFQISERTGSNEDPFSLVKDEIEEKLKREKTDIRFKEWQEELRNNAHIDVRI